MLEYLFGTENTSLSARVDFVHSPCVGLYVYKDTAVWEETLIFIELSNSFSLLLIWMPFGKT